MLDVSTVHPFVACTAFAVEWLAYLAAYDLARAEALIDANDSGIPFSQSFPEPEGFTYCHPDQVEDWGLHLSPWIEMASVWTSRCHSARRVFAQWWRDSA